MQERHLKEQEQAEADGKADYNGYTSVLSNREHPLVGLKIDGNHVAVGRLHTVVADCPAVAIEHVASGLQRKRRW